MWPLDRIVSFCKSRGFAFASSELYGGLGVGYDYGPAGAALKKRVTDAWWQRFVYSRRDCVPLDAALLSHPRALAASGHTARFVDPACVCAACGKRARADTLVLAAGAAAAARGGAGAQWASPAAAICGRKAARRAARLLLPADEA